MTNEPKTMREIHEIRLKNYEAEKALTSAELRDKRKADILRVEKTIVEYGLKVKLGQNGTNENSDGVETLSLSAF